MSGCATVLLPEALRGPPRTTTPLCRSDAVYVVRGPQPMYTGAAEGERERMVWKGFGIRMQERAVPALLQPAQFSPSTRNHGLITG